LRFRGSSSSKACAASASTIRMVPRRLYTLSRVDDGIWISRLIGDCCCGVREDEEKKRIKEKKRN
jgi:hypothetical protein